MRPRCRLHLLCLHHLMPRNSLRAIGALALSVTVALLTSGVARATSFPDVPANHWAASYIQTLVERGVLRGHSDGFFRPQWSITRAEIAKVALLAAERSIHHDLMNGYDGDMRDSHSLRDEVLTASELGVLSPVEPGYIAPDDPATRAVTLEALLVAFDIPPASADEAPLFPDTSGETTRWANAAKRLGIVSGNNGRFLPWDPVTRAEAAKMAVRLLLRSNAEPPSSITDGGTTSCATRNGAVGQVFPPSNWWNLDISDAPVDASSAAFISTIGPSRAVHPDFGGNANADGSETYGFPYASVCGDQALSHVTYVEYGDESDVGAPGRPIGFPIPSEAKLQVGWIEGGAAGMVPPDGDRHMLIVDRDNGFLFELYHAHWTGSRWEAGSGAVFNLRTNDRRTEGWTSADAAGLAIFPGLVRYDEASADEIAHAFRTTVRSSNGHVWPASHSAGSTSGALPMGARLRLKANVDVAARTSDPVAQRILRAMQRYGLIVADNGADLYVQGTYDTRWDNDILNPALGTIHGSDFEVIELEWRP